MGSPLSRWRKPGRLRRDLEGLGLFAVIAVSSALFLLPRGDDGLLGFPELAPGDVAPRTVKSPRSFSTLDPRSTEESRERARDAVPEVFDHLLGLSGGATARLEVAFGAAAQAPSSQAAARFVQSLGVDLDPAAVEPLVAGPDGEELLDAASMLVEASFAQRLVHDPDRLASQGRVTIRSVDADEE